MVEPTLLTREGLFLSPTNSQNVVATINTGNFSADDLSRFLSSLPSEIVEQAFHSLGYSHQSDLTAHEWKIINYLDSSREGDWIHDGQHWHHLNERKAQSYGLPSGYALRVSRESLLDKGLITFIQKGNRPKSPKFYRLTNAVTTRLIARENRALSDEPNEKSTEFSRNSENKPQSARNLRANPACSESGDSKSAREPRAFLTTDTPKRAKNPRNSLQGARKNRTTDQECAEPSHTFNDPSLTVRKNRSLSKMKNESSRSENPHFDENPDKSARKNHANLEKSQRNHEFFKESYLKDSCMTHDSLEEKSNSEPDSGPARSPKKRSAKSGRPKYKNAEMHKPIVDEMARLLQISSQNRSGIKRLAQSAGKFREMDGTPQDVVGVYNYLIANGYSPAMMTPIVFVDKLGVYRQARQDMVDNPDNRAMRRAIAEGLGLSISRDLVLQWKVTQVAQRVLDGGYGITPEQMLRLRECERDIKLGFLIQSLPKFKRWLEEQAHAADQVTSPANVTHEQTEAELLADWANELGLSA